MGWPKDKPGYWKGKKRPEHSQRMTGRKRPEHSKFMKENNPMLGVELPM